MVFVYALSNEINNEVYIGITKDITRRLKEHNSGGNRYTKAYKPWKVFYSEVCDNYAAARKREVYFKTTSGRRELRGKLSEIKLLNTE
jgi:predicted GIY-YIG superfamily endonuclease